VNERASPDTTSLMMAHGPASGKDVADGATPRPKELREVRLGPTVRVFERLGQESRRVLFAWAVAATMAVAVVDVGVGTAVSLRFLYVLPVIAMVFAYGKWGGAAAAAASAVATAVVVVVHDPRTPLVPLWLNLGLRFAVLGVLSLVIAELRYLAAEHAYIARHDTLTGVLSRSGFIDALERERERCARERLPLALVHVDLDRFKLMWHRNGERAADALIVKMAAVLRAATGDPDVVGRLGADQFVVMLGGAVLDDAYGVARQVRKAALAEVDDERCLGPSINIAYFTRIPESTDLLVNAADDLVYERAERAQQWPDAADVPPSARVRPA
jgi:diguanylate cyclase (GGDEF)-like protein